MSRKDWKKSTVNLLTVELIPIENLDFDPDNPNVEDPSVFNDVVDSMREDGWLENVVVRPGTEDGRYTVVSGEHRVRAGRLLGYTEAPCVVKGYTDEEAKVRLVRLNALKGHMDPAKFTALYRKLERSMNPEKLRKALGYGNRAAEIDKLTRQVERALPAGGPRDALKERRAGIRNTGDLAVAVQSITQGGGTQGANYILFAFGGTTHLMVKANEDTFRAVRQLADYCRDNGDRLDETLSDAATIMLEYLETGQPRGIRWSAPTPSDPAESPADPSDAGQDPARAAADTPLDLRVLGEADLARASYTGDIDEEELADAVNELFPLTGDIEPMTAPEATPGTRTEGRARRRSRRKAE
jgi:hypothetical protein